MGGGDHLETAPFLQMEPKTWPSNQQSWPVTQPEPTWDVFHLWPCGACVPFLAMIIFPFLVLFFVIFCAMSLVTGILCSGPLSFGCCCLYSWRFSKSWQTDLYQKVIYLAYYFENRGLPRPQVHPKFMPVDDMKPKKKLEKEYLDYGLNIQVPKGGEDQFLKEYYTPKLLENFVEDRLHWLPISMHYASFGPNENPVDYVMSQLSPIYPAIYQEWNDKHSDDALTRICLYGIGAHRVEVECQDGQFYVVRTNCLSGLPVRDGFESYGGDAYFNEAWRPVMIVDQGLQEDSKVVVRPGDDDWERCKFRFRSSLFSLVTLVDHLYFLHLQLANFFVTSVREQMSESHPIRRFLTPFTYQTISINDNAAHNLVAPRSMGPRCFAMTDQGFNLAFAAAPHLQVWGYEVPAEDGGPLLNLKNYFAYKKRHGVDTEYFRQASELYEIYHRFLSSYVECYYPTKEALVKDEELLAMAEHFFIDSEAAAAGSMGRRHPWVKIIDADAPVEEAYEFYLDWLASLIRMVTAGHEQMGAVEVYAQDVSWTSFKWLKGATCGTKQTATAQALLMSFTSTPMPKLIGDGDDWSHLFPKASVLAGRTPELCYKKFHEDLKAMSLRCEQYNAEAHTRPFPECFPMYTNNPGVLECSISV